MATNFGYLGASWGNKANQGSQNYQAWGNAYGQNRQAQNQYNLANRGFNIQKNLDANSQRDQMLRFGVGALTGLLK
jgi:hypothetical protein